MVRLMSDGGTTMRQSVAGLSPAIRSAMRQSQQRVTRATTGSRWRPRDDVAVESTPERWSQTCSTAPRAADAMTGCGPASPRCGVALSDTSVGRPDRTGMAPTPVKSRWTLHRGRRRPAGNAWPSPVVPAFERSFGSTRMLARSVRRAPPVRPFALRGEDCRRPTQRWSGRTAARCRGRWPIPAQSGRGNNKSDAIAGAGRCEAQYCSGPSGADMGGGDVRSPRRPTGAGRRA